MASMGHHAKGGDAAAALCQGSASHSALNTAPLGLYNPLQPDGQPLGCQLPVLKIPG